MDGGNVNIGHLWDSIKGNGSEGEFGNGNRRTMSTVQEAAAEIFANREVGVGIGTVRYYDIREPMSLGLAVSGDLLVGFIYRAYPYPGNVVGAVEAEVIMAGTIYRLTLADGVMTMALYGETVVPLLCLGAGTPVSIRTLGEAAATVDIVYGFLPFKTRQLLRHAPMVMAGLPGERLAVFMGGTFATTTVTAGTTAVAAFSN